MVGEHATRKWREPVDASNNGGRIEERFEKGSFVMSTAELIKEIELLSNPDRLKVIEATTALVREDLIAENVRRRADRAQRMRAAALEAKDLYEPGGELTEWTVLDGEEVLDDYVDGHANQPLEG